MAGTTLVDKALEKELTEVAEQVTDNTLALDSLSNINTEAELEAGQVLPDMPELEGDSLLHDPPQGGTPQQDPDKPKEIEALQAQNKELREQNQQLQEQVKELNTQMVEILALLRNQQQGGAQAGAGQVTAPPPEEGEPATGEAPKAVQQPEGPPSTNPLPEGLLAQLRARVERRDADRRAEEAAAEAPEEAGGSAQAGASPGAGGAELTPAARAAVGSLAAQNEDLRRRLAALERAGGVTPEGGYAPSASRETEREGQTRLDELEARRDRLREEREKVNLEEQREIERIKLERDTSIERSLEGVKTDTEQALSRIDVTCTQQAIRGGYDRLSLAIQRRIMDTEQYHREYRDDVKETRIAFLDRTAPIDRELLELEMQIAEEQSAENFARITERMAQGRLPENIARLQLEAATERARIRMERLNDRFVRFEDSLQRERDEIGRLSEREFEQSRMQLFENRDLTIRQFEVTRDQVLAERVQREEQRIRSREMTQEERDRETRRRSETLGQIFGIIGIIRSF